MGFLDFLALFMLTSSRRRFCRIAGTNSDVATVMGGDMAGWLGRHVRRNSDMGANAGTDAVYDVGSGDRRR